MLRLRDQLERASTRPWSRLLVVLMIGFLLALTVAHVTHDVLEHDDAAAMVCIAIAFVVALSLRPRRGAVPARTAVDFAHALPKRPRAGRQAARLMFIPLRR